MQQQVRKVIIVGNSKGLTLPRDWLHYLQRKYGFELQEVLMTVTELAITISPILPTPRKETNHD